MPVVSVIIPNYNHEKYLDKRIQSILQQTFQDFEIIILDDASVDNSKIIIEKYKDHPKIKLVVCNDENSGTTFKQWKKGIELAVTDWIWIAESDDYCDSNFLELLAPALHESKCTLAYNELIMVDEQHQHLRKSNSGKQGFLEGKSFIQQKLLNNFVLWNAGMLIFRRLAALPFLEELCSYRYAGDQFLYTAIVSKGSVYASGIYAAYFLHHDKSLSASLLFSDLQYREQLNTYQKLQRQKLLPKKYVGNWCRLKLAEVWSARKGLTDTDFTKRCRFWLKIAEGQHVKIKFWQVWWSSKMLNAGHFLNKRL